MQPKAFKHLNKIHSKNYQASSHIMQLHLQRLLLPIPSTCDCVGSIMTSNPQYLRPCGIHHEQIYLYIYISISLKSGQPRFWFFFVIFVIVVIVYLYIYIRLRSPRDWRQETWEQHPLVESNGNSMV